MTTSEAPNVNREWFANAQAALTASPEGDQQTKNGGLLGMCLALEAQVEELRAVLNQLQPCLEIPAMTTLEAIKSEPTMRVRIQHSHTLKEGWRLSETTVEWTGEGHPDFKAIEAAQNGAFAIGANEARFRNAPQSTSDEDGGE